MKQKMKNVLIITMMTIFYTIILTYFFPQLKSLLMLDRVIKLSEDLEQELSITFNRIKQVQTSSGELKTSDPNVKKKKKVGIPTYYIKAALNEESYLIDGQVSLTIDNPKTDTILFYTYPYTWSPMNVTKVVLNGKEVTFSHDYKQLIIKNPKKEKELNFSIEFTTPVPQKGTRFGYKDDVWLITTWYPMLGVLDENNTWKDRPDPIGMGDPFLFNYANYVVEWTSIPAIKWLSSGTLISEEIINNKRMTTWKVSKARNFALAGSDNFQIKKLQFKGNTTVSIALTDHDKFSKITDIVKFSFPLFQSIYGQLPYSDIGIIETGPDTNFALEYPNLATFSKDLYVNNEIEHWLPHEIGHMWWYNAVGVNEVKDGWIDEGLAELGVVLYLENRYNASRGKRLRKVYRERNQLLIQNSPHLTMDVGLYGYKNKKEYYDSWYARSADMLLTLRDEIGKEKFNVFLNILYQNNIGKTINEDSISQALDESLNLKTHLFQNWVHEPYHQTNWDAKVTSTTDISSEKAQKGMKPSGTSESH